MTGPARPGDGPDEDGGAPARPHSRSPEQLFARLTGVTRTLLIPLLARHLASRRPDPILTDPAATEVLRRIGKGNLSGDWSFRAVETGTAVRSQLIDTAVRALVDAHPGATVVTIGAGLCTRCLRLAGLEARWIDVDLAPVAELRRSVLPAAANRTVVSGSALDATWHRQLQTKSGPHVFVLEGLTMYLHEPEVRALLVGIAEDFPDSHLLIETVGPRHDPPGCWQQLRERRTTGVQFSWGVRDHRTLVSWHQSLEHVATWHVLDHHPDAWPLLVRVLRHLPSIRVQSKVIHLHVQPARLGGS